MESRKEREKKQFVSANPRPRIAVFAYSEVGYVCLDELIRDGANVAVVFTHEDDPGEGIWFRSVHALAARHGIPVRTDERLGADAAACLRASSVELALSFFYRAMIPDEVIALPRLGAYNVHGALLPKYRGRACINWALINGERETGATLHRMTTMADRGDIVDREVVSIDRTDTAYSLSLKVAAASGRVVVRSIAALESGAPRTTPQDEAQATKFGRRRPEDGRIDWTKSAEEIYNFIRALTHPFPGAFTCEVGEKLCAAKKIYIWRAGVLPDDGVLRRPGEVVSHMPPVVATGEGLLEIFSYQPEGEPERSMKA